MRIISWNMQGKMINALELRQMLNSLGADVLILQEPYGQLSLEAPTTGQATRRSSVTVSGPTWTVKHFPASPESASQDRYAIATSENVTLEYSLVVANPGPKPQPGESRQYLIAKLKKDGTRVKIATCHAPFQMGRESRNETNVTAAMYMQYLMAELSHGFNRPPKGTGAHLSPEKKTVDVFMGDSNVYDSSECKYSGWVKALGSATGGKGRGGSLDRILLRAGALAKYRCGRIYVQGRGVSTLSSADRRGGVQDIVLTAGQLNEGWMKSDHIPIYLDTDPDNDGRDAVIAPVEKKGVKRRSDVDLVELDDRGQLKKLKS
jgi:endonuclease/exonuclease/phosphatase family metal-dependent hydrolase